jgi:protein subunit release factor A
MTVEKEEAMSVIVEIRAAEGGDDAKSLVEEQFALYAKRALRDGL